MQSCFTCFSSLLYLCALWRGCLCFYIILWCVLVACSGLGVLFRWNNIWETGKWTSTWTTSIVITIHKNDNLQLCNNYRTISLISHGSKVMLKIILNRLNPLAENIIAEAHAGYRHVRCTIGHIFNLRILCEKHLQHQRNIYHVFIDFKKAFDRVGHGAI